MKAMLYGAYSVLIAGRRRLHLSLHAYEEIGANPATLLAIRVGSAPSWANVADKFHAMECAIRIRSFPKSSRAPMIFLVSGGFSSMGSELYSGPLQSLNS
jgi:hypothetical protein